MANKTDIIYKELGELCYFGKVKFDDNDEGTLELGIFDKDYCGEDIHDDDYDPYYSYITKFEDKKKIDDNTNVIYICKTKYEIDISFSEKLLYDFDQCYDRHILCVKNPDEVNIKYLYYYLLTYREIVEKHFNKMKDKYDFDYKELPIINDFKKTKIPLPSVKCQKTILNLETRLKLLRDIKVQENVSIAKINKTILRLFRKACISRDTSNIQYVQIRDNFKIKKWNPGKHSVALGIDYDVSRYERYIWIKDDSVKCVGHRGCFYLVCKSELDIKYVMFIFNYIIKFSTLIIKNDTDRNDLHDVILDQWIPHYDDMKYILDQYEILSHTNKIRHLELDHIKLIKKCVSNIV